MSYQKVQVPVGTPSELVQLIQRHIDPLLADVHTMLRLPLPTVGLGASCNLSSALVLLSVERRVGRNMRFSGLAAQVG